MDHIKELAIDAHKMRAIVANTAMPTALRYRAIIIEEGMLDLMKRYISKIEELKEGSLNGVKYI